MTENTSRSISRRRFLKVGAGAAIAGIATPVYAFGIEPDHPRVTRKEIKIAGWPHAATGLKIGHLSDLHCQDSRAEARTVHAVQMLLDENPDVVFLTGDYISNGFGTSWIDSVSNALAPLRNVPRGVYAVLGNHDYAGGHVAQLVGALKQVGFHLLENQSVVLPGTDNLWIVGLQSRSICAQDPVQAMREVPTDAAKVLLIHEPDYADEAPLGIDLQFSGHSHAGQVRIPGLPPLHCPTFGQRYPEGLQQARHHLVYTTRGVGMMGPQIRFCCPPEVMLLTVHSA